MALTQNRLAALVKLVVDEIAAGQPADRAKRLADGLAPLVNEAEQAPTTDKRERDLLTTGPPDSKLLDLVLRLVGTPAVTAVWSAVPEDERRPPPLRPGRQVLSAAVRIAADPQHADPEDAASVAAWVRKKGAQVMPTYRAERKGLPRGFDEASYVATVADQLAELNFPKDKFPAFHAVVVGKVLLQGLFDTDRSDFKQAVRRAYEDGIDSTQGSPPNGDAPPLIKNYKTYEDVANDIAAIRGDQPVRYQELASVADYVVASADSWPVDDPTTRRTQVQIGLTRYVDGTADTGFAALDLPPVISEDASEQEIEPPNCEAVALCAAAAEIEQTGAFDAVDAMLSRFLDGLLPVRDDPGGRALDRYYWDSEDRMDAAARAQIYARVVGQGGGGDTSSDVQPNAGFRDLLLRVASSFARYDADLRIANVIALDREETSGTSEFVRKASHDLMANVSLYGWGYTIFAARRLKRHIDQVFEVLGQESLQRAYGVTGPWQLVERVAAVELGSSPNVVAHRTMAKATKDIIDILARYATQLSVSGATGRFLPSAAEIAQGRTRPGTAVGIPDYEKLVSAANNLLAVNGVAEEDVYKMAQPVRSPQAPSIPTVGGGGGGAGGGAAQSAIDQITQLVSQGQAPSLEQLQRLLPGGVGG